MQPEDRKKLLSVRETPLLINSDGDLNKDVENEDEQTRRQDSPTAASYSPLSRPNRVGATANGSDHNFEASNSMSGGSGGSNFEASNSMSGGGGGTVDNLTEEERDVVKFTYNSDSWHTTHSLHVVVCMAV